MANLTETPQWEPGIYQLETTDPVLGGPEGISNRAARELGNRTAYLKAQQEQHAGAVDPHPQYAPLHSPVLTGVPTAPTAASATHSTQIATTEFVQVAIAALISQAPDALDTLNELAQALGNDADFATTMTKALAAKAPLASPQLTGVPAAPTAAAGTSTTQLATTAFVLGQAATTAPAGPGVPATGTSVRYAREDHVHPESRAIVPAGTVCYVAMLAVPAGWLKANGAAVSRTAYAALYENIGTMFGAGDGSTTFNLPDLRGEFIRGWDDGRSLDAGRVFSSVQAQSVQSHTHEISTFDANNAGVLTFNDGSGDLILSTDNTGTYGVQRDGRYYTKATGSTETRPRNIALQACIKY